MEIFRSLEEAAAAGGRSVVTIGSFDGIHLAHQELLRRVRQSAGKEGAAAVAITFHPHPMQLLAPGKAPRLLTPLSVKLALLEQSGLQRLLLLPFTEELSRWPPEKFVQEVLVRVLRAVKVVVGDNFRFGHRQAGSPELLRRTGAGSGFQTEVLSRIEVRGRTVSSSQVRGLLEEGNVSLAGRLLGRPFSVCNPVQEGLGIGRRETVPTLNLAPYGEMLPATGVYVTRTRIGSRFFRSVTNVGRRPTFGERELGVETHLLDTWEGLAPESMEVSFLHRLRAERKFASPAELKTQIRSDVHCATTYFRRLERFCAATA